MPIYIREIVSEVVLETQGDQGTDAASPAPQPADINLDDVVRRATERVLAILQREWER